MTLDPRNMPYGRAAAFLSTETSVTSHDANQALKAESILLEEFNFAGVTAYQAREDSAALINIYLIATGALATGLGVMVNAYSNGTRSTITIVATVALAIFAIFSFAFFVRFLGLEQEYREGMLAMGVIKEFYIQRLRKTAPEIELAFHWRLRKRPRGATLAGGAPLVAWTIALLAGLAVGGAVGEARQFYSILANVSVPYTPEPILGLRAPFAWELLFGALILAAHFAYFNLVARARRERTQTEAVEQASRIERALNPRV